MNYKNYTIGFFIFITSLFNLNAGGSCDWYAKKINVTFKDSCDPNSNVCFLIGTVNSAGQPYYSEVSVNDYSIYVLSLTNNRFITTIYANGNYKVGVEFRDETNIQNSNVCDTTIYYTVNVNCLKSCNWSKRAIYDLTIHDSCAIGVSKESYIETSCFTSVYEDKFIDYQWTISGSPMLLNMKWGNPGKSRAVSKVIPGHTYEVCLKLIDTVSNCDTTICKTVTACIQLNEASSHSPTFSIFPNPAQTYVEIKGLKDAGSYCLTDVSGRHIRHGMLLETAARIPLNEIARGIYNLSIMQGTQSANYRLILE